jgi:oligoribonuclease NrnB/cAMP/cGMP phosphodiesterase (DHH superfamily)
MTAAWVCYKALDPAFEGMVSDVEYVPCNYSDPPPDVRGKEVYIVDFSFKRDIMEKIIYEADRTVVLDHHKTAEEALKGLEEETVPQSIIVFDMNRSGAGLAWDYFFPDSSRPVLVDYIEDRDLWRFKLPHSKEINAFYQSFDINLETWIKELGPRSNDPSVYEEGKSLLRLESKYVKQICHNAYLKKIGNYIAPYVQTSVIMSEVCDYLIKNYPGNYPFAFYSFRRNDGKFQYGLRSRSDFDVSVIAKEFGGGGHKQAAGFELDYEL